MTPPDGRPALSRRRVVAAALEIVDREGVRGLTMRALGRELGVDPMAAYHHVPNKEAILDGVVEAVWAEVDPPPPSDLPWQQQLVEVARSIRATLARHPNALPLMASRPNVSVPGFEVVDHVLGVMLDAGLAPEDALALVNAAGEFLLGHALAETGPPLAGGDDDILDAVSDVDRDGRLPHLRRVLAEVDLSRVTSDAIFEAGVASLVAGAQQRLGV